jgi:hypothetical protein
MQELADATAAFKSTVKSCLLQLHRALIVQKTCFDYFSNASRLWHERWDLSLSRSYSWSAIALNTAVLSNSIAWADIKASISVVSKDRCLRSMPRKGLGFVPSISDRVVYYPAGHAMALALEQKNAELPRMWSRTYKAFNDNFECDDSVRFEENAACVCVVTNVSYVLCGPTELPDQCNRFAQVELRVIDEVAGVPSKYKYGVDRIEDIAAYHNAVTKCMKKAGEYFPSDEKEQEFVDKLVCWLRQFDGAYGGVSGERLADVVQASNVTSRLSGFTTRNKLLYVSVLTRVLSKILSILVANPAFAAFRSFVDEKQFPDYYDVIKFPVCLETVQNYVTELRYVRPVHFYYAMRLMRDNCVTYCEGRFPEMIEVANLLLFVSIAMCERMIASATERYDLFVDKNSDLDQKLKQPIDAVPSAISAAATVSGDELSEKKTEDSLAVHDDSGALNDKTSSTRDPDDDSGGPAGPMKRLLQPVPGQAFRVCIRLSSGSPEYVISLQKYLNASKPYPIGGCFKMKYLAVDEGIEDNSLVCRNVISCGYFLELNILFSFRVLL